MKSRIIAVVEGKFFNTIRSWAFVNSLEDCEVEDNCCCRGQVFFNTIRFILRTGAGISFSRTMTSFFFDACQIRNEISNVQQENVKFPYLSQPVSQSRDRRFGNGGLKILDPNQFDYLCILLQYMTWPSSRYSVSMTAPASSIIFIWSPEGVLTKQN